MVRKHAGQTEYSKARIAWVNLGGNEFILYEVGKEDDNPEEEQEGYTLLIRTPRQRTMLRLPLAIFTEDEMVALQEFMSYVFEKAIPTASKLDSMARQEWEEHGKDYARLYRPAPQIVIRERDVGQHPPRVPGGSDGVEGVDRGTGNGGDS